MMGKHVEVALLPSAELSKLQFFMPVGTRGAVIHLDTRDYADFGNGSSP